MAIIVQKFGGSSLADINCIRGVAEIIKHEALKGNQVVAVVSAMFGNTDNLLQMCREIRPAIDNQAVSEYDVVISSGEQIAAGLVSLALQNIGIAAMSLVNWQIKLRTDSSHTKARIESLENANEILKILASGKVIIVPGFQGISKNDRITTLGRGGSDTSAIAIAIALSAERCDIYKDVDGVYTADPKICTKAKKIDHLSHEEMLELSSTGSKVLQTRAVEIAMRHNFDIYVRSTFKLDNKGTVISSKNIAKSNTICGISHTLKEVMFSITEIENFVAFFDIFLENLEKENIEIDMIINNEYEKNGLELGDLTFAVLDSEVLRLEKIIAKMKDLFKFQTTVNREVAKISIIGAKIDSEKGIAAKMFHVVSKHSIQTLAISTSNIKVSILVSSIFAELAIRVIHDEFF